jgi:hypothetical protein
MFVALVVHDKLRLAGKLLCVQASAWQAKLGQKAGLPGAMKC